MSLRLVHVHLPDGTVTPPMPMGRVMEMLERKEITLDTQICDHGTEHWSLLRYEPAVLRPLAPRTAEPMYRIAPDEEDSPDLGERLNKAALIFTVLGLVGGIFAAAEFGPGGFVAGLSGPLSLAIIMAVLGYVMKGRRI